MTVTIQNATVLGNCQPKPRSVLGTLGHMIAVARQRRHLRALDDRMLKDIGISRHDALAEGRQTIWNAPDHWLK